MPHEHWVNSDLMRMAKELDEQAKAIGDHEPNAVPRQVGLVRASAHLHLAFAELAAMPLASPVSKRSERG